MSLNNTNQTNVSRFICLYNFFVPEASQVFRTSIKLVMNLCDKSCVTRAGGENAGHFTNDYIRIFTRIYTEIFGYIYRSNTFVQALCLRISKPKLPAIQKSTYYISLIIRVHFFASQKYSQKLIEF